MKCQNSIASEYDKSAITRQLLSHEVATVPTETVEGYAVLLDDKIAIHKLMKLKNRGFESGKVFTLVPKDKSDIKKYVIVPESAKELIKKYVPGEITLILPKNPDFKNYYFDHFDSIGIRIPDHEFYTEILKATGPMLLTSANPRGGTPKSITGHLPSTIVDFTGDSPKIIRQGNLKVL
ncbi:Sua5/YciO/YrdC/YwlC family protein [Candidatus Saccharibacteria bacterium]|nr:Sua5/YciO/YrdC/YwlC family protein [Candidatus Saccharibacteria bacterium]